MHIQDSDYQQNHIDIFQSLLQQFKTHLLQITLIICDSIQLYNNNENNNIFKSFSFITLTHLSHQVLL